MLNPKNNIFKIHCQKSQKRRQGPYRLIFSWLNFLCFRGTVVAFIESIQVETLRAQNTGKIGHGDDGGFSSNLATLAGLVVVLFSKNLPKISEVKELLPYY